MTANATYLRKWMELIRVMLDGQGHTVAELTEVLGTTRRNFYYVMRDFASLGLTVNHQGRTYALDPQSPLLAGLATSVNLSHEEASYISALLTEAAQKSPEAGLLQRKLAHYYHLNTDEDARQRQRVLDNAMQLDRAIELQRVVILHNYSSPHSDSVSDRVVEPFLFLGGREDIRAYELKSGQNKTFKLSRIGSVEMVDTPWFHTEKHREVFTDIFMFSGEERHSVDLVLDRLAHHLLIEECPLSANDMHQLDDEHWELRTDVVSYLGIGRFVLGLYSNIQILSDDGLKAYLGRKIREMGEGGGNLI